MKPNLKDGRLIPPRSVEEGYKRKQQLHHEIHRIEDQIDDPTRILHYENQAAYTTWRASAGVALKRFYSEESQLCTWILETLLNEAYRLLDKLENEVDFEPEETAVMVRLDKHFGAKEERRTA